jgi:hypothetical protein
MKWEIPNLLCYKGRNLSDLFQGFTSKFIQYLQGLYSGSVREGFGKASGVPEGFPKKSRIQLLDNPKPKGTHMEGTSTDP